MITTAVEQLVVELKAMPYTMIIVLSLIGFAVFAHSTHASAEDIRDLAAQVAANTGKADKILKLQLAESLRTLQEQRCNTEERDTRRTLTQTIEELQEDYKEIDGARYPLKPCG